MDAFVQHASSRVPSILGAIVVRVAERVGFCAVAGIAKEKNKITRKQENFRQGRITCCKICVEESVKSVHKGLVKQSNYQVIVK
jgi:hypothetical protein